MDAHHISRLTNLQMLELEGLIVPPPLNGIKRELKCLILRNVSRLHPSIIKEFTVNSNLTTLVFTQASADYTTLSGSLLHIKYLGIAIYPQTVNQVTKFLQSNGAHIESLELHYGHDAPSMMQRMSSLPSLKKLIIYDKSSINERLSDIIAWRHVAMMKL